MIDLSIPIILGLTVSIGVSTGKLLSYMLNPRVVNQAIDKIHELNKQAKRIKELRDK